MRADLPFLPVAMALEMGTICEIAGSKLMQLRNAFTSIEGGALLPPCTRRAVCM